MSHCLLSLFFKWRKYCCFYWWTEFLPLGFSVSSFPFRSIETCASTTRHNVHKATLSLQQSLTFALSCCIQADLSPSAPKGITSFTPHSEKPLKEAESIGEAFYSALNEWMKKPLFAFNYRSQQSHDCKWWTTSFTLANVPVSRWRHGCCVRKPPGHRPTAVRSVRASRRTIPGQTFRFGTPDTWVLQHSSLHFILQQRCHKADERVQPLSAQRHILLSEILMVSQQKPNWHDEQ